MSERRTHFIIVKIQDPTKLTGQWNALVREVIAHAVLNATKYSAARREEDVFQATNPRVLLDTLKV